MTSRRVSPRAVIVVVATLLVACDPLPGADGDGGTDGGVAEGSTSASSSGLQPIDGQKLCGRLVSECGQPTTVTECTASYAGVRVTPTCIAQINGATCADLTAPSSNVLSLCFPSCSAAAIPTCNADGTLSVCSAVSRVRVTDCQASCVADGYSGWTGTCGTSYNGQTSEQPKCWCK
jgi:hypothetical protein